MKVLITGAGGFIGSSISNHLVGLGLFPRLATRQPTLTFSTNQEVFNIDWDSDQSIREACSGIDCIIHAAGLNAADSYSNPAKSFYVNAVLTARLAAAARYENVKRLLYFSTAHVYASSLVGSITEATCPTNFHPYAASHLAGEHSLRFFAQSGDLEVLVMRLANAFGAPVHPSINCWSLLALDLCRQFATTKKLTLTSNGLQYRNFIPLSTLTNIIFSIITSDISLNDVGIVNVGGL